MARPPEPEFQITLNFQASLTALWLQKLKANVYILCPAPFVQGPASMSGRMVKCFCFSVVWYKLSFFSCGGCTYDKIVDEYKIEVVIHSFKTRSKVWYSSSLETQRKGTWKWPFWMISLVHITVYFNVPRVRVEATAWTDHSTYEFAQLCYTLCLTCLTLSRSEWIPAWIKVVVLLLDSVSLFGQHHFTDSRNIPAGLGQVCLD